MKEKQQGRQAVNRSSCLEERDGEQGVFELGSKTAGGSGMEVKSGCMAKGVEVIQRVRKPVSEKACSCFGQYLKDRKKGKEK